MGRENIKFPSIIFGLSPLGGNCDEGTTTEGVPLQWDYRVGSYISEQAAEELDDREITRDKQRVFEEEERFRLKAGFRK